MLDESVEAFVRRSLRPAPGRVLEVGAGSGELASVLESAGYDVVAIDPAASTPTVRPVALHELAEPAGSFDAAVAVVSLHHVSPLPESCARLGSLVRPGGVLVVDEIDVERYDERAASWWLARHSEPFEHEPPAAGEMVAQLRGHIHSLDAVRGALSASFELSAVERGPYLYRWELPPGLRVEEERDIALGRLAATGARFVGTRR